MLKLEKILLLLLNLGLLDQQKLGKLSNWWSSRIFCHLNIGNNVKINGSGVLVILKTIQLLEETLHLMQVYLIDHMFILKI